MKHPRQAIFSILFVSILLLLGMLFWPFIFKEIITPISLVAWLFLRIFVLSIDQKFYWGAIIFVVFIFLFRFIPKEEIPIQSGDAMESNEMLRTIDYWSRLFTLNSNDLQNEKAFRRELVRLMVAMYASKQRTSANFGLYGVLERGDIPLPEHIHSFLFKDDSKDSGHTVDRLIRSIRQTPQKWINRWTGREKAEYYRMINEILSYIETSLEINNDDGKFTTNQH
ncbi:MAG TPA: hypothetical protein VF338_09295 [Leptolinea sp.]